MTMPTRSLLAATATFTMLLSADARAFAAEPPAAPAQARPGDEAAGGSSTAEGASPPARKVARKAKWEDKRETWERDGQRIDQEPSSFRGMMSGARRSRCSTAICWGPSNRWAIEPLAEIPVGKTVALLPSSLGGYINTSGINLRFNAGLRFWSEWDWWSLAIYFSTPEIQAKETLVIRASPFAYPVSQIRRPFPGAAIGLFGDNLWIGFDYDQLRNGGSETTRDPRFPPNVVVSRSFSITFAIAPFAGFRNGIGTLVDANQAKKQRTAAADDAREAAEQARRAASRADELVRDAAIRQARAIAEAFKRRLQDESPEPLAPAAIEPPP